MLSDLSIFLLLFFLDLLLSMAMSVNFYQMPDNTYEQL